MKTRGRNQKVDLDAYKKMQDFWTEKFNVLEILNDLNEREAKKHEVLDSERAIFLSEMK